MMGVEVAECARLVFLGNATYGRCSSGLPTSSFRCQTLGRRPSISSALGRLITENRKLRFTTTHVYIHIYIYIYIYMHMRI